MSKALKANALRIASMTGLLPALRTLKGHQVTVLSLHRISEEPDLFFDPIRPALFERILQYCIKHYEVVGFADLERETRKPKLILSFDDGYYDFMEHALPLLLKYGLRCNHNLVNVSLNNGEPIWTQRLNDIFHALKKHNIVDDVDILALGCRFSNDWNRYNICVLHKMLHTPAAARNDLLNRLALRYGVTNNVRMMTWEDAIYCAESGVVEIGSHTYNHDSLSTVHEKEALDLEIGKSLLEFETNLRRKITILAAPNGQYSTESIGYARSKGIRHFLLVDGKTNSQNELHRPFSLTSRVGLMNEPFSSCALRMELFFTRLQHLL